MAGTITSSVASGCGTYTFALATPQDDAGLRRLLRDNPMEGDIRIAFEREPDFFAASGLMGTTHQTVVSKVRETGRVIGMGTRSIRMMYVAGDVRPSGYLSELRVDAAHRGQRHLVRKGYEFGRALHADGATKYYLTSILSDNRQARRFLEAGLPGMPAYLPLGTYHTLVFATPRGSARHSTACERASVEHRQAVADCLHRYYRKLAWAPCWTPGELGAQERTPGLVMSDFLVTTAGSRVTGCMALWDQRGFRQVVVRGYSTRLARWRHLLNACSPLTGLPRLPDSGKPWAYAYVSPLAIDGNDPDLFTGLLRDTLRRASVHGYDYVVLGLAERHPLLHVAKAVARCRELISLLYCVSWDGMPPDIEQIRAAIPHPEVALL